MRVACLCRAFDWAFRMASAQFWRAAGARSRLATLPLQAAKDSVTLQPARSGCDNRRKQPMLLKFDSLRFG